MTLGEKIAAQRKRCELSQEKVAELLGVSRQAVTKWESDQSKPSMENIFKLAKVFKISVNALIGSPYDEKQFILESIENLYRLREEKNAKERENEIKLLIKIFLFTSFLLLISALFVFFLTKGEGYIAALIQGVISVSFLITALSLHLGQKVEKKRK